MLDHNKRHFHKFFIGKDGKRFQKVDIIFNFVEEIHSLTASQTERKAMNEQKKTA
jgi:site-specific DNA recombinase